MPNEYIISLKNENATGNYVFFQAQPIMTQAVGPIDPSNIFSNVWVSQGCAKDGNIVITTTRDFYACKLHDSDYGLGLNFRLTGAGTIKKPAAVGTTVVGGKALPATLGTDKPGSELILLSVGSIDGD